MNGVALGVGVGGGVDVGGTGTPAATVVARTLASIVACTFGVFVGVSLEAVEVAGGCVTWVGDHRLPSPIVWEDRVEVAGGCVSCANCGGRDNPCVDA